jgi:hypothetical protein
MTTQTETFETFMDQQPVQPTYRVIHPLYDTPEVKRSVDGLGPIQLSRGGRAALVALRFYLLAVMLMGGYRVVTLAHHLKH